MRHWRFAAVHDQVARVAITVRLTTAAHSARSPVERFAIPSTIGRSSRPTSVNSVALRTKVTISQNASP